MIHAFIQFLLSTTAIKAYCLDSSTQTLEFLVLQHENCTCKSHTSITKVHMLPSPSYTPITYPANISLCIVLVSSLSPLPAISGFSLPIRYLNNQFLFIIRHVRRCNGLILSLNIGYSIFWRSCHTTTTRLS